MPFIYKYINESFCRIFYDLDNNRNAHKFVVCMMEMNFFLFQAITFFVYTGLEILAFLAFVLLAIQYKYVTYEIDEVVSEHGDADHQRRRTLSCSHSELTARAMRKKSNVHENDGFENTRF